MKRTVYISTLVLCCLLFGSCHYGLHIEKRKFRKGWYITYANKGGKSGQNHLISWEENAISTPDAPDTMNTANAVTISSTPVAEANAIAPAEDETQIREKVQPEQHPNTTVQNNVLQNHPQVRKSPAQNEPDGTLAKICLIVAFSPWFFILGLIVAYSGIIIWWFVLPLALVLLIWLVIRWKSSNWPVWTVCCVMLALISVILLALLLL